MSFSTLMRLERAVKGGGVNHLAFSGGAWLEVDILTMVSNRNRWVGTQKFKPKAEGAKPDGCGHD